MGINLVAEETRLKQICALSEECNKSSIAIKELADTVAKIGQAIIKLGNTNDADTVILNNSDDDGDYVITTSCAEGSTSYSANRFLTKEHTWSRDSKKAIKFKSRFDAEDVELFLRRNNHIDVPISIDKLLN